MGKYINQTSTGQGLPALGKTQSLVLDGAVKLNNPAEWQENLVCVVDNGFFEAAAYCYNEGEFRAFSQPGGRSKDWLIYPHAAKVAN